MDLFSNDPCGICGEPVSGMAVHDGADIVRMHLPALCEDIDQTANPKEVCLGTKGPYRDEWVQVRSDRAGHFVDTSSLPSAFLGDPAGVPGPGHREAMLTIELRCEEADVMHENGEIQRLSVEIRFVRGLFVGDGGKVVAAVTVFDELRARRLVQKGFGRTSRRRIRRCPRAKFD